MIPLDMLNSPITEQQLRTLQPELASLQGNILRGHGRDHAVHLLWRFQAGQQGIVRAQLRSMAQAGEITSALTQRAQSQNRGSAPHSLFCSVFLSAEGYRYLNPDLLRGFSREFQEGMKRASERLHDDPTVWEPAYAQDFHVMVLLAHADLQMLQHAVQRIQGYFASVAQVALAEWGRVLRVEDKPVEHFGYVDGISQPLFFEKDVGRERRRDGTDKWDPSAGPDLVLIRDPNGGELDFGSYLVFRKLEQNVQGFAQQVKKLAGALRRGTSQAGALAIGRFPDGTPIVLQDADCLPDTYHNNFSFETDRDGGRCPYQAHIRKANPRNDIADARDRRIARRGITYGERALDLSSCP